MAKTVLIVEDNELNMKLFRDLLEAHGYRTVGAREHGRRQFRIGVDQDDVRRKRDQLRRVPGNAAHVRCPAILDAHVTADGPGARPF